MLIAKVFSIGLFERSEALLVRLVYLNQGGVSLVNAFLMVCSPFEYPAGSALKFILSPSYRMLLLHARSSDTRLV